MRIRMSSNFKSYWDDAPTYPEGKRFVLEDDRFFVSRHSSGAALLFVHEIEGNSFGQIEDIFSGLHDRIANLYIYMQRTDAKLYMHQMVFCFTNIK